MTVGIYVRVSTEEQVKDGFSISAQKNKLLSFCDFNDWNNYKIYVDEGISAKDMNRPELKKMLLDIENGLIKTVLVYRLDRLTRSVLDLYKLLELFDKYDCKFKSATEVYDTTTAMGRMFITLVAAMAQWERENLGERVSMGLQQKAKEGKYVPSLPPYGYKKVGTDTLEVIEEEAEIVKEIFDMYTKERIGVAKIARTLNERNIPKRNSVWQQQPLRYILRNPVYIGRYRYNYRVNKENYFEVDADIEKIISEEQFYEAQRIIEMKKDQHPRNAVNNHYFISVAYCALCGKKLNGASSGSKESKYRRYYYRCRNADIGSCKQKSFTQSMIEIQFLKKIDEWIVNEELISKVNVEKENIEDTEKKIKKLNKELESIESRKKKWQYAWVNDLITDEDFKKRIEEEDNQELVVRNKLNQLSNQVLTNDKSQLLELVKNLRNNWEVLDKVEKKRFVEMTVKKMTLNKISSKPVPESVDIEEITFL